MAVLLSIIGLIAITIHYHMVMRSVIEERDEQLFSLAYSFDTSVVHKLSELDGEMEFLLHRHSYAEIEPKLEEFSSLNELNDYFAASHLFRKDSLEGIVVLNDQDEQIYALYQNDLSNDYQYAFMDDNDGDGMYVCYDQFGKYSIALERISPNNPAYRYYTLVDLNHFYDSIVPKKLQESHWVVFYDRGCGLLLQNHDNQDAWMVLTEDEIRERKDGYSIILKNDLADTQGAETYYYPNYHEVMVPERIITLPRSQTENGYFSIGISRDSDQLYNDLRRGRNRQLFFMVLLLISGMIITWFIIENQNTLKNAERDLEEQKRKKELLEAQMKEKELMNALEEAQMQNSIHQLQPHFLYNSLSSIREIVLESPEYGAEMLMEFTNFLRACLRAMSSKELIPFSQELKNIKAYVNIEKMRLGDRLVVVYDIQEKDFLIIPLGVQPLVENAIRHGISKKRNKTGTVTIRSYREDDSIIISVEDNGIGFDVEKTVQEITSGKRDSTGIANLAMRYENGMNAKLDGTSQIGVGTRAFIKIPIKDSLGGNDESSNS